MAVPASLSFLSFLCKLRWAAVAGQSLTVLLVTRYFGIELPSVSLWAAILLLALFNLYAWLRIRTARPAFDAEIFAHMVVDVGVLTWLIAMSGGLENPFSSLFLLPIALSIPALPPVFIAATAAISCLGYGVSTYFAGRLPPIPMSEGGVFGLHMLGMRANFAISVLVILLFFTAVVAARRRTEREVAQLREQFTRNEGIVALATHAASVAHELNTPLATLTLMVDDLAQDAASEAAREEFATLRALLDICRDRVRALAAPAGDGRGVFAPVDLESVIQRWQLVRPTIELHRSGRLAGVGKVDPAVGHLLQALLNNAADAGERAGIARVDLELSADAAGLHGSIRDYGAGFDVARSPLPAALFRSDKPHGLGIGLALSHATVERLGGVLSMRSTGGQGVRVDFTLPEVAA